MQPETKKRNALILLVGGLNYHAAIADLVFVVGAFMIIAGGLIHINIISRLEKEIAELQKRNGTGPDESSNG